MSFGFLQLSRDPKVDELLEHSPSAFLLATQIARRARRTNGGLNPHGLEMGEALVGDYATIGLTRQAYRTAKDNLQKWGLATFRTTNKGTIAKLVDSTIYDINAEDNNQPSNQQPNRQPNQQRTSKQPAPNQQATTNEEWNNGISEESSPFSPDGGVSEETGKTLPVPEPEVKPEPPAVSRQQQQAEQIYSAYPKKAGRQEALKHIRLALKAAAFDHLLERTQAYAAAVAKWPAGDRQYIPDPVRWFKRGNYDDDPQIWERSANAGNGRWQSNHGPAAPTTYDGDF